MSLTTRHAFDSRLNDNPTTSLGYGETEKQRGAIYTKTAVVEFMLDLVGYTIDKPLHEMRYLEPSFGSGSFVLSAVNRLIKSWRAHGGSDPQDLRGAICAVELDELTNHRFEHVLLQHLVGLGIARQASEELTNAWLRTEDFLLTSDLGSFDFVVGNPPYIRQERIPDELLRIYKSKYPTMVGRADIYIAFMHHSLDLLSQSGTLSFICADAWTKNDYGRGIRGKISSDYSLTHYVDMYGLDAFEIEVGAYPSITVISRGKYTTTRVTHAESTDPGYLRNLASKLKDEKQASTEFLAVKAMRGTSPWLLSMSASIPVIHDLETNFPTIVEAGCRVGIGVATGADKVYVRNFADLEVEESRKFPLATNKDVTNGVLNWTGKGVVNPWRDEGGLVDLDDYPRLAAYLEPFRPQLGRRHTAKGNVERNWYKTIDRINPTLKDEPKLLIPDIKDNGDSIAYDPGELYPHHNLYYITSDEWNLRALQALLRSGIAHLFVSAYSVKIGGGFLRFQAQNLKRIRIPYWQDISSADQREMQETGEAGGKLSIELLERVYQLEAGTLSFMRGE